MLLPRVCLLWLLSLLPCFASVLEPINHDELPAFIKDMLVLRSSPRLQRRDGAIFGRSDGSTEIIAPKVMIISLFSPEADVWYEPLGLYANNVTVPGLSPLYPDVHCNTKGSICQITTGEGEINAASTTAALLASPLFDLQKTYFFIAGIAGINPACGTIGGVNLARYAVQVGLEYEIDPRHLTKNYTSRAGYIPLGQDAPDTYPINIYGTEVFELSKSLRDRAFSVMKKAKLADSATAKQFRKLYEMAPARQPPNVFLGTVTTSDVYWHGKSLGDAFAEYTHQLTNGTGHYCMTAQEDNAILEAMLRGALAKKVDFGRILAMRTGSNFDRPHHGEQASTNLFYDNSGGFPISISNIFNAGNLFVQDVIKNWNSVYSDGIPLENYVGDIFGFLKGPFKPDIGSPDSQEG